jgi:hypothetical protein
LETLQVVIDDQRADVQRVIEVLDEVRAELRRRKETWYGVDRPDTISLRLKGRRLLSASLRNTVQM